MRKSVKQMICGMLALAMVFCMLPMGNEKAEGATITKTIEVNKDYNEVPIGGGAENLYSFVAPSNGYFEVSAKGSEIGSSCYFSLTVYDSSNNSLSYDYGTNCKSCKVSATKGTKYYIKLENGLDVSTLSVRVNFTADAKWEVEDNNSTKKANTLKNKTFCYGIINAGDSTDYYKFKLTKTSKVTLEFGPKEIDGTDEFWTVRLFNSDNEYQYVASFSKVCTKNTVFLKKGTYYLEVKSHFNYNMPYKIRYTSKAYTVKAPAIKKINLGKKLNPAIYNKKMRTMGTIKLKDTSSDTSGYSLMMAKKPKMKSRVDIGEKDRDLVSYGDTRSTIKRLSGNYYQCRTYYFKVRAYVKDPFGAKIYSKWSKEYKKAF